jgi:hypothetical protein
MFEKMRFGGGLERKSGGFAAAGVCAAFLAGAWFGPALKAAPATAQDAPPAADLAAERRPVIRHLVLIDFKPEASDAQIDELAAITLAFPAAIPGLERVEWGADVGDGTRSDGYDRAIAMTFADKESLAGYGGHPAHQALLAKAMPLVARLLVFDIEGSESGVCLPPATSEPAE